MKRLKIKASKLLEMVVLNWSEDATSKYGIKRDDVPRILEALKNGRWSIILEN